jgi:pimeloyl-ACP methyl ester carboxylesterase
MQPVRRSRSIVVVAALSLLCSRPLLAQGSTGGSDPTGRGGPVGQGGTGGAAPLDPSVKRTPVQAGKATGFLYQPAAPGEKARIGVFVMHFGSDYSNFSACSELTRRGYTVLCTKNSGGGLNEILPDARSSVEYLRSVDGVRKVVLWGHSGGATLMAAYQLMAENGVKACQGPEKIAKCPESLAGMPVADGLILADANWGNAVMTLLSIDPAVIDEGDPAKLDEDLNLFNPTNGYNAGGNSNYSPQFIKKWQSAVGRRNNAVVKSMVEKAAALGPESTDDPRVVVYGANSIGPNNKLFPQDVKLMAHTVKPWPLIHADGSVTTQIVHSVRVPSGRASSPQNGAINTTARRYLVDNAVRVTDGFGYDESSMYGVEWASSYASTPGNVEQIRVPSLFMGMTGGYEYLAAETIYEHSAARDKSLAFVEGASHGYGACRPCETTPGQFGDTVKTLYDYADRWLSQKGRF